jgi:hypothetical protein
LIIIQTGVLRMQEHPRGRLEVKEGVAIFIPGQKVGKAGAFSPEK